MTIQMVDVVGQYRKIKAEVDAAVHAVLDSGMFILGKDVGEFESAAAKYLGVGHAIGCASGTDALQIAMMAFGIGPGDEVITTPFTFVATAETIGILGAKPVYVDIDPATFNIDPSRIEAAITARTKAIIPVHLYGQAADMDPILAVGKKHRIPVIEDAAQAMGASYKGRKLGGFGAAGCISFFPSKSLGCFGDGGMIVTNDSALADRMRMIAAHGSRVRYYHEVLGVNSRLDTLQAAILRVKLGHLDEYPCNLLSGSVARAKGVRHVGGEKRGLSRHREGGFRGHFPSHPYRTDGRTTVGCGRGDQGILCKGLNHEAGLRFQ